MRLWGKIFENNIKLNEALVDININKPSQLKSNEELLISKITELTHELDLEMPVFIKKHRNDLFQYGRTTFYPSDFMENVSFDKFIIEIIIDADDK